MELCVIKSKVTVLVAYGCRTIFSESGPFNRCPVMATGSSPSPAKHSYQKRYLISLLIHLQGKGKKLHNMACKF
jgi:hypothetical protein